MMYIFRISEADCAMISLTAARGVSPDLRRRARNSRSVRRPPRVGRQVSSSLTRSGQMVDGWGVAAD